MVKAKQNSIAKLLRDATLERLEDKEDIQEGLKALANEDSTITWEQYQHRREEQVARCMEDTYRRL